ncbi:RelA/SpoT domain-containing protein [Pontibacter pudoricolor]|uniref:RelA/SpoT domain-containing protein n=1 Tax=Pontibacter pudoricolor TaxID=2694930 RepID=UPI001391D41C|nr:RelA/SpoT domain-containing protein [Pontibacter pudoricolor]
MANRARTAVLPYILSELNESEESLRAQGIEAETLLAIYNDYIGRVAELKTIATFVTDTLLRHKDVHAVRYRIKEPLHLLKKIIRKKQEYPSRYLNAANYTIYINDLAGVRILHLSKQSCHNIANYIQQNWELKREPYAYVKEGDTHDAKQFSALNYKVMMNSRGYKAQHYIIKVQATRQLYFIEIQVKTLFEEGWSEIDHCIRYPDHEPNELLNRLLWLLNQSTSNADMLATQMQALANELHNYQQGHKTGAKVTVSQLHSHIDDLPVDQQEKQYLYACLAKLTGSEL